MRKKQKISASEPTINPDELSQNVETIIYEPPKVSVVVAAYNVAKYLPKCLDSISAQTYTNLEIIVIDDGSTDSTSKVCDIYGQKEPRATIIHQENQGLSAARNTGIKEATSDYIIFVDGDDFLGLEYVECMIIGITKESADICVCGFSSVSEEEFKKKETPAIHDAEVPADAVMSGEEATKKLLTEQENYQVVAWNKIYKRDLFKRIRFPETKKYEDTLTTYKLLYKANRVSFISEILYFYTQRKSSIMGENKLDERLNAKLTAAQEAKEYFKKNEYLENAACIFELLAHYQFIDNIIAKRSKAKLSEHTNWIKENKATLLKNPLLTKKLKTYLNMSTRLGGTSYKVFRKLKH